MKLRKQSKNNYEIAEKLNNTNKRKQNKKHIRKPKRRTT